ncbi:hypothetical protein Vadar_029266 [Vaccinium darrowii]|uniref:Uncharacterized protein n=1 Tax=Vaccinium darrowii TaxID=229202 RepID=A0ACB7Y2E0_9ERIC|nr:hypothetical protein Vadar_029266 [Vaccinium darrowii]
MGPEISEEQDPKWWLQQEWNILKHLLLKEFELIVPQFIMLRGCPYPHVSTPTEYLSAKRDAIMLISTREGFYSSLKKDWAMKCILNGVLLQRYTDAAAWLEYFESKAFEQKEAARNGT